MKNKGLLLLIAVFAAFILSGCAGPGECVTIEDPAGFWWGLWNGLIMPITFIGSLFSDNVAIYDVHNNGGWYDFGFILGISSIFGSGGKAIS